MLTAALNAFKSWFNAPFQQPVSVPKLFLIVGLIMILIIIWGRIIGHLHERG